MANPTQSMSINDPGRGVPPVAADAFLVLGTSSAGTVNTVQAFNRSKAITDEYAEGPLPEMLCRLLAKGGGPVYGMKLNGSVASSAGSVTKTPVGSGTGTITATAQTPNDAYEVIVEILTTGTVGTGVFRYTLDDGRTWSAPITIPSGGTYAIPNANLTITFVPGAGPAFFEDGDLHSFDCTAPYYGTSDLATAVTALLADTTGLGMIVLLGKPASTADGATMMAALNTHLSSLKAQGRYVRAIMDAGDDTTTNAKTDFAASTSTRITVCYGDVDVASAKGFSGWAVPKRSLVFSVAERAHQALISEDLARVASGPMEDVLAISHDEEKNPAALDDAGFSTARTHQGLGGFYINNCRLKSPLGSDFEYLQHGRVMDKACDIVFKKQTQKLSSSVRTVPGTGVINEKDALHWESEIEEALNISLTQPKNKEGTKGHVSGEPDYVIDREQNIQSTSELIADVSLVPLGYAKRITTTIGFSI